ncbi:type II toxin-antitoxin system PemK/MazF family toxin [Globicatella sulfidifaciens]|uniref:type II toxin-antitoxin system PemK/MazF family toxin n=1 Tax=Globicatella sulfidifaciens TaxID=136093 RepID=UPI00288FF3B6|nr:type II toxin-antitoxin system PemK/MazF family toxin [Globicatella sulfidifaciens]MDT2767710.1 type II toxin-antitoxin system PemK/MazF family toxin [Globicatella sulfidifaciens]
MEEQDYLKKIKEYLDKYKKMNFKQYLNLIKSIYRLINHAIYENKYKGKKYKYWSFPRGSIVKVDFGFNVGYELGGVHYAVVINNKDSMNSGNICVLPLTSNKGKNLSYYEIDIGSELYDLLFMKAEFTGRDSNLFTVYQENLEKEISLLQSQHSLTEKKICLERHSTSAIHTYLLSSIDKKEIEYTDDSIYVSLDKIISAFEAAKSNYQINRSEELKSLAEIELLKINSICKIDQIRIVSKSRIINPKNIDDSLNKIKLSANTMDNITQKLHEYIMFDKS